jgi:hypothetical protein
MTEYAALSKTPHAWADGLMLVFQHPVSGGRISGGTECGGQRGSHRVCRALAAVKTKIPESSLFQAALVIRTTDVAGRRVFLPDDRHFHELGAIFHGVV